MASDFPALPTLEYWKTKSNEFTWKFEDGTSTFTATTQIESAAAGINKGCTLQNSDLEATVTLTDSDLTTGLAVGTYPYMLQTNSGGTETPISGVGRIIVYAEP